MRIFLAALLLALATAEPACSTAPLPFMLELTVQGRKIEGTPVGWNEDLVHLLGRDGRLWHFHPKEAAEFRQTSDHFRSFSVSEFRAAMLRELGSEYEVSGTGHYLVAHPRGARDLWAQRFEDLYRSLVHYISVRGFRPEEPAFPLIGVVARNRDEFQRQSIEHGQAVPSAVLGYYSLENNRILLYDTSKPRGGSTDWRQNASVTIHEATHQTAFNTGIHNRYTAPPLWVAEGLATLFEAPGVYDSRSYPALPDRINRDRCSQFLQYVAPHHRPEVLADLVASDQLFRRSPGAAYAEAWALTFYLVETQPSKYFDYLGRTAKRPSFSQYTAAQRRADFAAVFGEDWRMLEAQFLRFMKNLPAKKQ